MVKRTINFSITAPTVTCVAVLGLDLLSILETDKVAAMALNAKTFTDSRSELTRPFGLKLHMNHPWDKIFQIYKTYLVPASRMTTMTVHSK